jgi:hypothetical protein
MHTHVHTHVHKHVRTRAHTCAHTAIATARSGARQTHQQSSAATDWRNADEPTTNPAPHGRGAPCCESRLLASLLAGVLMTRRHSDPSGHRMDTRTRTHTHTHTHTQTHTHSRIHQRAHLRACAAELAHTSGRACARPRREQPSVQSQRSNGGRAQAAAGDGPAGRPGRDHVASAWRARALST